jgi:hypothetical protein
MRSYVLIAALAGAVGAHAAGTTHYLDVVNTADNSIASFAIAVPGSNAYRDVSLGSAPLHGGGDSATVAIRSDANDCQRDLRIGFADGRILFQKNFDICKYRSYHTGQYLRRHDRGTLVALP